MRFSERRTAWAAIYALVRPDRYRLVVVAVLSLVAGLLEAGFLLLVTTSALAITRGEDAVTVASVTLSVPSTLLVAAVLLVGRLLGLVVTVALNTGLAIRVGNRLRKRLADAYLGTSWAVQQEEPNGRLQQLLTDFAKQAVAAVNGLTSAVTAALNLVALVVMAFVVDVRATAAVVVILAAMSAVLAPLRSRIRRTSAVANQQTMALATGVSELGSMGLEMQAFGRRAQFIERVHAMIEAEARAWRRPDALRQGVGPVYTCLGYGALLGSLLLARSAGTGGLESTGAVILLMLRCLSYGQNLQTSSASIASSVPAIHALEQMAHRYHSAPAAQGRTIPSRVVPIEVEAVTFAYDDRGPALEDLSLSIAGGEAVGIVGPSGGGKSTLVQLLLGLRSPTAGRILVGGTDLQEVDRQWWASRVAFVPQEALLFSGTIAENIAFFRPDLTTEQITAAAIQANLDRDVQEMADCYDTEVGERGSRLSGGQRQRLAIARALAGRPDLLILDEPTSALDMESERLVRDTLTRLKGTTTVVVIAHRLTTLEDCDRTMVIEGGRLVAFGDATELVSSNAFYRRVVELSEVR